MDHLNTHNDCRDGNRDVSANNQPLVDMSNPREVNFGGRSHHGGGQGHGDSLTFSDPFSHCHGGGRQEHGGHNDHHDRGHHDGGHGRHGHDSHGHHGGRGNDSHGHRGHDSHHHNDRGHDSFDLSHLNLDRLSLDELIDLGNAVANQLEHDLASLSNGHGGQGGQGAGGGDSGSHTGSDTPTQPIPGSGSDTPAQPTTGAGSDTPPPTSGTGSDTTPPPTSGTGSDSTPPGAATGGDTPGSDAPAPPGGGGNSGSDSPLPPTSGSGSDNPTPPPAQTGGGDNPVPTGTDATQPTNVGTDASGRYTDSVIQMLRATDPRLADTLVGAHGLMSSSGFAKFEALVAAKYTADSVDGTLPTYGALLVSASRELQGDDRTGAQKAIQQELSLHGDGAVSTYVPDMQVLELMASDPTLAEAIRNAQVSAGLGQMSEAGSALFEEEIVALVAEDAYYHTFPKDDSLLAAASALQAPGNDALYANVASQNAISTKGNQYVSTYA